MKTDLKNQNKEQKYLLDRLKRLEKSGKRMVPKTKKRNDPLQHNKFERKTKRVEGVGHKIDYEPHREKAFEKQLNLEKKKEEMELMECTFNPSLDSKSMNLAQTKDHILNREIPDKYKRKILEEKMRKREEELLQEELNTMKLPDYKGKQFDEKFYEKTTTWKYEKIEKSKKKLEENLEKEKSTLIGQPTLNEKSKLLSSQKLGNEDFLKRLPKYVEEKKKKHEELDKKYHTYSFKPEISAVSKKINQMNKN